MPDPRLRNTQHLPPPQVEAPAKIDLLHVQAKIGIQQAGFPESVTAQEEAGAAAPENFQRLIVLAAVCLGGIHDPSAQKRIAEPVEKPSAGPGIFQLPRIGHRQDLRLPGSHAGIAPEHLHQRLDKSGINRHIIIQQTKIFPGGDLQPLVITPGIKIIFGVLVHLYFRIMGLHKGHAVICGAVIDQDDLQIGIGTAPQGIQQVFQEPFSVVVERDDRYQRCICLFTHRFIRLSVSKTSPIISK